MLKRIIGTLLAALLLGGMAHAANLTPDELTQATSIGNTDLLVIYPTGGPLKSVQWSVAVTQMQAALGSTYLLASNNLSDVSSPTSARTNLGLGSAATQNTSTMGHNIPFLDGANTWSAAQTWQAGGASAYPFGFQPGSLLTSPLAGAFEWDGTSGYLTKTSGPTREKIAYADGSNLGANAVALANIAQIATNTVLANGTSGTANVSAFAMPSCSTATSALIWTTNTGFGCQTISTGTGTVITTGSPASGNLAKFSGTTSVTNADISGDCTTSGTVAIVCTKTNGVAFGTGATAAFGTTANTIAQGNDSRFGGPTQNGQCSYTLVIGDAGKQIYCNTSGSHTLTIPANGSVAFATGTKLDVINDCSAGNLTISITTDTLVWFTAGTTGSRTLQACGEATLSKVSSTRWVITGAGIT